MRVASRIAVASAALVATASAAENYLGFNSGATKADRTAKFKSDFVAEMTTAQNLEGAPGTFNSVRLYTNIQAYSDSDPIEAFEAAIETKTKLLLGMWCSGTDSIEKEINALRAAVDQHGDELASLLIGISIGSEDLYRDSEQGVANKAGIGAGPEVILGFINDFREAFADSPISDIQIGHVDTWDAWTNSSNSAVIDAVDWLGVDEYPYYEGGKSNSIENSGYLFDRAFNATIAVAGDKPVWMTETGWPATGPDWDQAKPSVENARFYWSEIGCRMLFNKVPTFWYTLRDSNPENKMKFAITDDLSTTPLYDLSCPDTFETQYSSEDPPPGTENNGTTFVPPESVTGTDDSDAGSSSSDPSSEGDDGSAAAGLFVPWTIALGAVAALFSLL